MKIVVAGDLYNRVVEATSFEIEGSREKFAVHQAISADKLLRGRWTATHIETGLAIGRGNTSDCAISDARATWMSKTPQEREEAILRGRAIQDVRRGLPEVLQ